MKVIFRSRHDKKITQGLKDYATKKMNKLETFFAQISNVEIEIYEEKNPRITKNQVVEVTLHSRGHILRAKEASTSVNASIDLVFEKLEKQVKKYKEKLYASNARKAEKAEVAGTIDDGEIEDRVDNLVKTKNFELKPMSTEEAIHQMDMLGHAFYVYTNSKTDEINVVYKRKDKNVGLIMPVYKP